MDGVTKISKIELKPSEDSKVENFRKMILAMSKDIRVILIKLADGYHNMLTLSFLTSDKQIEIAPGNTGDLCPSCSQAGN